MTHKILSFKDLSIFPEDVFRQMGYAETPPSSQVMAMTKEVIRQAEMVVRPSFGFVTVDAQLQGHLLSVGDVAMHIGRIIAKQLAESEAFTFFVATAGKEIESLQQKMLSEGDTVSAYIIDALGSVVAERCADLMEGYLQESIDKLGWKHTNRFSPGYCQWSVSEQPKVFGLLGNATCGVTLNAQCMMKPVKSVSGVIGLGSKVRHMDYTCGICGLRDCVYRKC